MMNNLAHFSVELDEPFPKYKVIEDNFSEDSAYITIMGNKQYLENMYKMAQFKNLYTDRCIGEAEKITTAKNANKLTVDGAVVEASKTKKRSKPKALPKQAALAEPHA